MVVNPNLARLLLAIVVSPVVAAQPQEPLAIYHTDQEFISHLRAHFALSTVEVNDPVYKRRQEYRGFWLNDVLKNVSGTQSEEDLYLRFRCKDGYLPVMPLSRALGGHALIAINDVRATQGQDWQPFVTNGKRTTPGPAYLVWAGDPGNTDSYPWPYQMVAIEVVPASVALKGMGPDLSNARGYEIFVQHCFKCHALNGIGGTLGPELNIPCSVTEYWNPRLLSRFIHKSTSIRSSSKMPMFQELSEKDVESIVDYLGYMAHRKTDRGSCQ